MPTLLFWEWFGNFEIVLRFAGLTRFWRRPKQRLGPRVVGLAVVVGVEFGKTEQEGEKAGGEAAHGDHKHEPAAVGVGPLVADAAENRKGESGRHRADGEDDGAGGEEFAGVGAHRGSGVRSFVRVGRLGASGRLASMA